MNRIRLWFRRLTSPRRCLGCGYGVLAEYDWHAGLWNCPRCGTEWMNR